MKPFFFIALYLFLSLNSTLLIAQNNVVSYFNKVYGNDTINILSQVVKPVDDGYLLFGNCRTTHYAAVYIANLDHYGNMQWFRFIDSLNTAVLAPDIIGLFENGSAVTQLTDKSIVGTYYKYEDIIAVKFSQIGTLLWKRLYEKQNYQIPKQIIPTIDGGFAIAGVTANAAQDSSWGYLLKLNYLGNFEWDRQYERSNSVTFFSVQQWWDGTYIMGGWGWNGTDYDMWVVKTDEQGDTLWTKALGGAHNDYAASVSVLTTWEDWYYNNAPITYLVAGYDGFEDFIDKQSVIKLSEDGDTIIWQRWYSNNDIFQLSSLQTMPIIYPDGSFLGISGYYNQDFPDQGFRAAVLMKFKNNGTVEWYKKLFPENTFAEAYIKDLQRTPDGGYVMAGYQYSPMPQKGWVLKMDADFNTCSFAGCDSTVYVGVGEELVLPPQDRFRVSPNPAQDYFTIENNSLGQNITFVLYDVMGRRVLSFIPENQSVVPIEHLYSGVYLYQILNPQNQILQHGKISIVR
jgi:hypothetical protein